MKIHLDAAKGEMHVGRRSLSLYAEQHRSYDFFCEDQLTFADIRGLRGCDLPERVCIQLDVDRVLRRSYPYADILDVRRRARCFRMDVYCWYYLTHWREPMSFEDFYEKFVRHLKKYARLRLHASPPPVDEFTVTIMGDFPLSRQLSSAYAETLRLVRSIHQETAADLVARVYRRTLEREMRESAKKFRTLRPRGFICHDSRDKELVARPIAVALASLGCHVWYDEFTLRVGDRLRDTVETGLKIAEKCILIISPKFIENTGWTKVEFNSVFMRELLEKQTIFLPVWAGVSRKQVFRYSPSLADRLGVSWGLGVHEVVGRLYEALRPRGGSAR